MLFVITLLSGCLGSTEPQLGKYYLIDEDETINPDSYIKIIDKGSLEFVNVNSDEYVDVLYENMISITIKDEKTSAGKVIYKEGASSEDTELILGEFANDIDGVVKYYFERNGNVYNLFVQLTYSSGILEYFPEEKEIAFYNQRFKLQ
jgi:hypothetical protein